jgi:histidinol-phosphate aminotransferase
MPESAKKAMAAAVEDLGRYPDSNGFDLKRALAARYTVPMDWITLGNGSNDILELAAASTLAPGRSCIYAQHSFAVYALATQARGARAIVVPGEATAHTSTRCSRQLRRHDADVRANPNNPTGTFLRADQMSALPAFRRGRRGHRRSLQQYLRPELRFDSTQWVTIPNPARLRTFQKAFGLAGLRVGYGIAQARLSDLLNRVRQPFNVNTAAQAAAVAALSDDAFLLAATLNLRDMLQLTDGPARARPRVRSSYGNFILIKVGAAGRVYEELLKRGVIVGRLQYQRPVAAGDRFARGEPALPRRAAGGAGAAHARNSR